MNRSPFAAAFFVPFLFALSSGCRTYHGQYYVGSDDYVLATRDAGDGRKDTYRVQVAGEGSLRVSTEYDRERPFLGFQVEEIDKARAERRGVKPYSGLHVVGTYPGSAASEGGVHTGDVLLSIAGKETVYLPQVGEIERTLNANQVVVAKVLRGQTETELQLTTKMLKERVSDEQSIPLEGVNEPHRPYAGVTLRGIPAVWCEKIFGQRRDAIVVTNVEVGSPAWLAGIRGGDVIDAVDGAACPPIAELSRRIAEMGPAEQPMKWSVRRGPGTSHDGTVELQDYSGEANAWLPLIFYLENGTYEDHWTIGPFGLVMSNRNTYIADQKTRRVETRNVFSALLGLFRVETSPNETEVRLLWIIRFDT